MVSTLNKLSPKSISSLPAGFHSDGGNLYLRVKPSGTRSFIFRYTKNGLTTELGLGSTVFQSLKGARSLATEMRQALFSGREPHECSPFRKADHQNATFENIAREYVRTKSGEFSNEKHSKQWISTLETYAFPRIGGLTPADIEITHIKQLLQPIWATKSVTASRLRQRIERVLDMAEVLGLSEGKNPARWKGGLDQLLPNHAKTHKVRHHEALDYRRIPAFYKFLEGVDSASSRCLRFLILTATRSGECRGALRSEIDLTSGVWVIPAERMKMRREHRVPLSDPAISIIRCSSVVGTDDPEYLFRATGKKNISDTSLAKLAKRFVPGVTVHGFRSSFRQWAAEMTGFPREVCEAALAHLNQDKVEAAYQRSDLLAKRRELMNAWSNYCVSMTENKSLASGLRTE